MKTKPIYFDQVRLKSHERWMQLERDEELASPWRQLFNQILSPRHVISELLQNADDAGAAHVSVSLNDGVFVFQHDGQDFTADDFSSLCRFGYSNKRKMHTIGFRGIGFKSTFSLGSQVEVFSPTLQVAFDKKRFTQPIWLDTDEDFGQWTTIRVRVQQSQILEALQQNIQGWVENPVPLLFFQNIQRLSLDGRTVTRNDLAKGPVANSGWVRLTGADWEMRLLLIRSPLLEVDQAVQQEIQEERNDPDFEVQPLEIQLVLGLESQRLYQVLPTGVVLDLPFSINAPFIQDPARTAIKDPAASQLNRFLLIEAGKLAFDAFQSWIGNESLSLEERAQAYQMLPKPDIPTTTTIVGDCHRYILSAFEERLNNVPCLLSSDGKLADPKACLGLDAELLKIWEADELCAIFGRGSKYVLAGEVDSLSRERLEAWDLLENLSFQQIFNKLCQKNKLPNPGTEKLKRLWRFIGSKYNSLGFWIWRQAKDTLPIVPASDQKFLYPSEKILLPSKKDKQLTGEEFDFVQKYILILDKNWMAYLESLQKRAKELQEEENLIYRLSHELDILSGATIEKLMSEAVRNIFAQDNPGQDGIKIAHILARLEIRAPADLKYLCRDGRWRRVSDEQILLDDPELERILPKEIYETRVISSQYQKDLDRHELKIWTDWMKKPQSRLKTFIQPNRTSFDILTKSELTKFIQKRGGKLPAGFPLKRQEFSISDYDFEKELWIDWEKLAEQSPSFWTRLIRLIAMDWSNGWSERTNAEAGQVGYTNVHAIEHGKLTAEWLIRLRQKACVPDTFGNPRFPVELLIRNSQTAMLENIEPFVHPEFDQPDFHPLLKLLGVRERISDPQKILERLRALSQLEKPLITETATLYKTLDRLFAYFSEEIGQGLIQIFKEESLILGEDNRWYSSREVYQDNPEQIPGLPTLHVEIQGLNLWERLQIMKKPTLRDALDWLSSIKSGQILGKNDLKRVRAILAKYPHDVFIQNRHWLNLAEQWQPLDKLSYVLDQPSRAGELFEWVKTRTADFSMLGQRFLWLSLAEENNLIPLESALTYQILSIGFLYRATPAWIHDLADQLLRVKDVQSDVRGNQQASASLDLANIREHAGRLAETRWIPLRILQATPYLDGQPAGFPTTKKALWNGLFLYTEDGKNMPYHEVKSALIEPFRDPTIREAVGACIDRPSEWIEDYFAKYFVLSEGGHGAEEDWPVLTGADSAQDLSMTGDPISAADSNPPPERGDLVRDENPLDAADLEDQESEVDGADFHRKAARRKPLRPEERFAHFIGEDDFFWQADRKMFRSLSGNVIRQEEGLFPWVEYDPQGQALRRFRLEEGSLEEGLPLAAEALERIRADSADELTLVILDNRQYIQYNSSTLNRLIQEEKILIQPKTYLLRRNAPIE